MRIDKCTVDLGVLAQGLADDEWVHVAVIASENSRIHHHVVMLNSLVTGEHHYRVFDGYGHDPYVWLGEEGEEVEGWAVWPDDPPPFLTAHEQWSSPEMSDRKRVWALMKAYSEGARAVALALADASRRQENARGRYLDDLG